MKITKQIAIFMILLVIMIPVAFAQSTITINSYTGQDNVDGYMRSFDDYLEISTTVSLDENESISNFTANNLYIEIFGSEDAFDSCSGYTCTYTTSQADRSASEKNFLVKLYDDDSTVVASEELDFYIDGQDPSIEELDYPKYFTDDVNITVELKDTACSSCGNACSGISTIGLMFDDETKQTIEPDELACDYDGIIETSVADLNIEDGTQKFCLVVTDATQNSDEECHTITVDSTAPSISSSTFVIKDRNGNAIEHISTDGIPATAYVNITETVSGLDTTTVYANLSALNYYDGSDYEDILASCDTYEDGLYVCEWDLTVDVIDEEGNIYDSSIQITITADDNAGNEQKLTKSISLVKDDTAPVLLSLSSEYGSYLNAKNNTLTLEIQEEDSGFDDLNVYLDMSEASLGQKKADYCESTGTTWYCYWRDFSISSSVRHGAHVDIAPGTITDDADNAYDKDSSIEEETFTYDGEGPEFLNVTIGALGREADVITEGDVVYILAYLNDDVSGVDESNVYADFSDFDSSNDYSEADYCAEVDSDIWECYWEYIGSLDAGENIELNMLAYDKAGNLKDSDDDNVLAEIRVVGTIESAGDYWKEEVDVDQVPMLNPNFLYFTSSGTIVRFDTELEPSSGSLPYVHSFQYTSCQAAADLSNEVGSQNWYDASIIGQYYYEEEDRTSKYLLVNIPAFFYGKANATVEEGSQIDVVCTGSISQARSVYSDIYAENEEVNMTASIELIAGLYTEPSLTTVDKIQKSEKLLNALEKITKILGFWTKWGTRICGPINGVRVVANNVVTILKAFDTLAGGTATGYVAGMVEVTNFLNKFWYGARNADNYKGNIEETKIVDKSGEVLATELSYSSAKPFQNKYRIPSMGYLCDTVLCESCSESWNKLLLGQSNTNLKQGIYVGGQYVPNLLGTKFYFPFSPQENLVVALVCNPPCVPGIYAQLNIYREILVAYNTCLNIATMKGEDIVQCEEFLSAQICQNVVDAFFWHWFWDLKQLVISNVVQSVVMKGLAELTSCPAFTDDAAIVMPVCSTYRTVNAVITLAVTIPDTISTVSGIFNFEGNLFGNKTSEEQQAELEQQMDDDIGDQLGTTPTYE